MTKPRILRIFARYQQFGGEETVARKIHEDLMPWMNAEWFEGSTDELLGKGVIDRLAAPLKVIHHEAAARRFRELTRKAKYDALEIHNVLPALSPAIYAAAFDLGLPIVHFLHNYRLSCVNGSFLNHGQSCRRCIHGNFLPAFETKCWRESRAACGFMGIALSRVRRLRTFDRVSAWVALSSAQKNLHVQMGLPKSKLHVVPHYMVEQEPDSTTPPPHDGYVLFLGRLSPEKGILQLIKSWQEVPGHLGRLVIAGTGPLEREAIDLVRRLGLANVEFRGFVPPSQHRELWASAKFAVVPSIWDEPFGLVVLEAWANGRPLIVSNWGSLPETVAEAGLIVQVEREGELAAAMRTLLEDHGLTEELAARGRDKLRSQFNRELWLERIRAVYQSCGVSI
jgi:glycosyltransferase involved in cell wall biosynthesis